MTKTAAKRTWLWLTLAAALVTAGCGGPGALRRRDIAELLPSERADWNRPVRITAMAGGALEGDYHEGRRLLVFTSRASGGPDLWLEQDAPLGLAPARMLEPHSARDGSPRLGPKGRRVAFSSSRADAGGDIWLLTLRRGDVACAATWVFTAGGLLRVVTGGKMLRRLTGRDSADDHPCWHPDGKRVFFASAPSLRRPYDLWELNLKSGRRRRLTTDGGQMPDCSPDGRLLVYAARSSVGGGGVALHVLRLADGKAARLTAGDALDVYPCWSADGRRVFFSRYRLYTDGNGRIDTDDRPALFSVRLDERVFGRDPQLPPARQLTSYASSHLWPRPIPGGLLFASNRGAAPAAGGGTFNLWALSEGGEVPAFQRVSAFLDFARARHTDAAAGPWARLLAWQNAMWAARESRYSGNIEMNLPRWADAAEAWLRSADLLADLGQTADARSALDEVPRQFPDSPAATALARARLLALERRGMVGGQLAGAAEDWRKHLARAESLLEECERRALSPEPGTQTPRPIPGVGGLRTACALAQLGIGLTHQAMKEYPAALAALDRVTKEYPEQVDAAAQAMLATAEVYGVLDEPASVRAVYLALLRAYPRAEPYASRAAASVVESITAGGPAGPTVDERVSKLRELIESYRDEPVLPALAQNRIGDLLYEARDHARARRAFRRAIDRFPGEERQAAVAYLALAAIDVEQQKYASALDHYRELHGRLRGGEGEEDLYRRARDGYVNVALMKAARELETGDVPLAAGTYSGLLEFDPGLVPAHRGLVDCQERLGRLDEAIARYRAAAEHDPRDHVAHYALARAYSYYGPSDWLATRSATRRRAAIDREALKVLGQAVLVRHEVSYYHQLRGFLFSRIALATGDTEAPLQALESYLTALALSDPGRDRVGHAEALFNAAEGSLAVGRHENAYEYYRRAVATGFPLTGERGQAALEHMSRSALAVGKYESAVDMLQDALAGMAGLPPAADERERIQRLGRRARLVDQMALAHYLSGDHAAAQDDFRRTAALLEELIERDRGSRRAYTRNLLRARRNEALNIYHAVRSGRMSETHLQRAWDLFEATLDALDAVGVVQQQEEEAPGLITIEIEVAVGEEAGLARFDIEAEKRLIYTYLARISALAGRFEEAASLMEKKLALYPDLPEDTERLDMLTERAIVWSQLAEYRLRGAYRLRGGALKAAAEAFSSALRLDERAQNLEGQMDHCRSLGRVALRMARLPATERGMPDEELKAWLQRIIALHRDLLAKSAERQAARLTAQAVGLSANLAELTPLLEEADRAP